MTPSLAAQAASTTRGGHDDLPQPVTVCQSARRRQLLAAGEALYAGRLMRDA